MNTGAVLIAIACFLGSALGTALQPLIKHAMKHRVIRATLRRYPSKTAACACGMTFYGKDFK